MSKEKKERKKFAETKVGKFLKEKAPKILDSVGEFLPDSGGLGIVKNIISKDDSLTEEDKAFALQLLEYDMEEQKNVTERWQSDMASDSVLSKNVRPIILLASWFILILLVVVAWFGVEISHAYITMFEALEITVNAAYFGGRSFEKYTSIKR